MPVGANLQRFVSRPDLKPPRITIVQPARSTAGGYVFLAPSSGPGQRGPMILDDAGELVWFRPLDGPTATDFKVSLYRGEPVLTWWEGKSSNHGLPEGEWVVADASYRELARFTAADGRDADLHELTIGPSGTAFVTSYEVVTRNLSSTGGSVRGRVIGGIVQELELPRGRLLWEWRSLDHVAVDESHAKVGPRFDYFHVNSIDVDAAGDLLVSARNTWAVYKVDGRTGRVVWRLGGRRSDFELGRGLFFAWQHDARWHDGGRIISLFDNGAAPAVESQSSALVLALDAQRRRATLVRRYRHLPPQSAKFMGNAQLLPGGDVFVGWGSRPFVTEFGSDGGVHFDARLPHGGESYRTFRFPWVGRPHDAPVVAVAPGGALYASWNGATEIAAWRLLEGAAATGLEATATVPRRGFETALGDTRTTTRFAAVVAVDRNGAPLGTSRTIAL